ncbi:uncharacterized protein B0T23DRAFT_373787 [Neurospora hispaniola]|uniref:Uncharacterized protein n=1 Tax=Neurospora hispaniola TaxID=588809 RepID=A0AAJ0ICN6_9PEZI|nr:hypothetical protein B0T23DRAFT_373787 [Neurospora hispaniola]
MWKLDAVLLGLPTRVLCPPWYIKDHRKYPKPPQLFTLTVCPVLHQSVPQESRPHSPPSRAKSRESITCPRKFHHAPLVSHDLSRNISHQY